MSHVFISYVRENESQVDELCRILRSAGVKVWLDRDDLKPGEDWKMAIRHAIKDGMYFIACFSDEYSRRNRSYMNEELILAVEELRQRPGDRSWFIPVLLSDSKPPEREIGAGKTLSDLHWVSLLDDWDKGLSKILSVVKPSKSGAEDEHFGYREFPIQQIYDEIENASGRIKILVTWVYGVKRLADALIFAVNNGCNIEILFLDPESPTTLQRAGDIGFQKVEHGKEQIKANLREFQERLYGARFLSGKIDLRLYSSTPTFVMLHLGKRLIYCPLFSGAPAVEGPYLEVSFDDKGLFQKLTSYFSQTWNAAREYQLLPLRELNHDRSFAKLEGAWVNQENETHLYIRSIGSRLYGPYCYCGDDALDAYYYDWQAEGLDFFARFKWLERKIQGVALFTMTSPEVLEGCWWSTDFASHTFATLQRSRPSGGTTMTLRRNLKSNWPGWAKSFFRDREADLRLDA